MSRLTLKAMICLALLFGLSASAVAGDFIVGNPNPPVEVVPGVINGPESYAYLFHGNDGGSCPEQGFYLEAIHMLVDFPAEMLGQTIGFSAALYTAEFDGGAGRTLPGMPLCQSMPMDFLVTDPGMTELVAVMPICTPVIQNDFYFLVFNFETPFVAGMPIDDQPLYGIVYRNDGSGWIDLYDGLKTAAGKSIIWGDIVCSVPGVAGETDAWGEIKSLYR